MVQNFVYFPQHKKCVLLLYRCTLKNAQQCCHSQILIRRIKIITRQTIVKHRHDKSSWTVYFYLQKLHELNRLLTEKKVEAAWNLLTDVSRTKSRSRKLAKQTSKVLRGLQDIHELKQAKGNQDPQIVREKQILNDYIRKEQARNRLPQVIPDEYKVKLLLPLALHGKAMIKLNKIRREVSTRPKVYLTHTAPVGHTIWFVRSALNKKKRQSKALGSLIRREKLEGHKRWNYLLECKSNAYWAQQEANWEQLIDGKTVSQFSLNRYLDSPTATDKEILESTPQLRDWLWPIIYSVRMLSQANVNKVKYFENYKNSVLLNGQIQHFKKKSIELHKKRLKRYKQMTQDDLAYVAPFFSNRDLPSTLNKYHF